MYLVDKIDLMMSFGQLHLFVGVDIKLWIACWNG